MYVNALLNCIQCIYSIGGALYKAKFNFKDARTNNQLDFYTEVLYKNLLLRLMPGLKSEGCHMNKN